jgi:hypothetical protein
LAVSKRFESRLERLENRFGQRAITVIYYFKNEETLEQRKQRFLEEEGYELPDHAKVICYRVIEPNSQDWPKNESKKALSKAV